MVNGPIRQVWIMILVSRDLAKKGILDEFCRYGFGIL